jgi:hypothetical protein
MGDAFTFGEVPRDVAPLLPFCQGDPVLLALFFSNAPLGSHRVVSV